MTYSLSQALPTTTALTNFQQKLADAKKLTFRIDFDSEKILASSFSPAERKVLEQHCSQHKLSLESTHLPKTLDVVSDYITKIPELTITMAVEPNKSIIQTLSELLHVQLKKAVVLTFRIDTSIVAGAKLEFQGKVQSHTIANTIEKVFYEK
ncbi:MAG: F0F1 ATP synthase subunit delta [Patescibacteria group bacterium]